jgi:hypothetical protein
MLYEFPCPLCGTKLESDETVELDETHEPDGTLVRMRVHHGAHVLHECETTPRSIDVVPEPPMRHEEPPPSPEGD